MICHLSLRNPQSPPIPPPQNAMQIVGELFFGEVNKCHHKSEPRQPTERRTRTHRAAARARSTEQGRRVIAEGNYTKCKFCIIRGISKSTRILIDRVCFLIIALIIVLCKPGTDKFLRNATVHRLRVCRVMLSAIGRISP